MGETTLAEDDEVNFEAGVNVATSARKATRVQLLAKANGDSGRRELGQVPTGILQLLVGSQCVDA